MSCDELERLPAGPTHTIEKDMHRFDGVEALLEETQYVSAGCYFWEAVLFPNGQDRQGRSFHSASSCF